MVGLLDGVELGPKMRALSNEKQQLFVWHYVTQLDGSASKAAIAAGYATNEKWPGQVRKRACLLMHDRRIMDAIKELAEQALGGLLIPSLKATKALIENPDHPGHTRAVLSALSRLGFGERQALDVNVSGRVAVDHTARALESLEKMIADGASEEVLLYHYGPNGLAYFRDMLAARRKAPDALPSPEVIDVTPSVPDAPGPQEPEAGHADV